MRKRKKPACSIPEGVFPFQAGLANRLGQNGIPFVVGMRESITDRAGLQVPRSFCDVLVEKKRLDLVAQEVREKITRTFSSGEVLRDGHSSSESKEMTLGGNRACLCFMWRNL